MKLVLARVGFELGLERVGFGIEISGSGIGEVGVGFRVGVGIRVGDSWVWN